MRYTYKVDNINRTENTLGVVYINDDPEINNEYLKISFEDGATEQTLVDLIHAYAPIELWELAVEKKKLPVSINVGKTQYFSAQQVKSARERLTDEIPIERMANDTKEHLRQQAEMTVASFKGKYTPEEIELWPALLTQAREVIELNGQNEKITDTVARELKTLADAKNRDLLAMAKSVVDNHEFYSQLRLAVTAELKSRVTVIDRGLSDLYAGKKTRFEMRKLLADNEALSFSPGSLNTQLVETKG